MPNWILRSYIGNKYRNPRSINEASVLEKHVKPYGVRSVDSFFSITIKQLKSMIKVISENEKSNGNV